MHEVELSKRQRGRIFERDPEPILVRPGGDVLLNGAQQVIHRVYLDVERKRVAVQTSDVEEIRYQMIQTVCLLFDDQRTLIAQMLELVSETLYSRERGSQVVR